MSWQLKPRHLLAASTLPLTFMVLVLNAHAQSNVIERNLPEAPVAMEGSLVQVEASAGSTDDTPLGVALSGIILIGADTEVPARSVSGITLHGVDDTYADAVRIALAPYLGQPLSGALIARAQAKVAGVWREAGYPFMSVTVPPQEVTEGVLTLRVIEFVAGTVSADQPQLRAAIRQEAGQPISSARLSEDLAWLNRNPFREINAVFAPGDRSGVSDIELTVTADKPVTVYAGWDNTGSPATGGDRWYIGGGAWLPALNDTTLAWRYTRGNDIWGGDPFALRADGPGYLSFAGRIDLPTLPRQAVSIAPNYVATNEFLANSPISFENTTFELPMLYRMAVSNILPSPHWGDVYFGFEPKWLSRQTRFAGITIAEGNVSVANLVLGWSNTVADPYGQTALDIRLKANPGGITAMNTAADWAAFTGGRVTDNTYINAGLSIDRWTRLPHGLTWYSALLGQIAGQALPDTERLALAGHSAVRGYANGEASADAGIVWRNELRAPAIRPLEQSGIADSLSPFAFVDLGWGHDFAAATDQTIASAGLGFDYSIGENFNIGGTAAVALKDAATTRAGDWSITANIRFTY